MRVLIVIASMDPAQGGPPRIALGHAISLARRGHSPVIASLTSGALAKSTLDTWSAATAARGVEVPIHLFPYTGPARLGYSRAFNQFIGREIGSFDVVHQHGVWEHCLAYSGRRAHERGLKVVITPHGMLDRWSRARSSTKKAVSSLLFGTWNNLKAADGLQFGTDDERHETEELSLRGKAFVIPNGVYAEDLREQEGVATPSSARPVVLFFSRMHPKKGVLHLLEGFRAAVSDGRDAVLRICAIAQDQGYEESVRDRIRELGLQSQVELHVSPTGRHEIDPFKDVEIFTLPSFEEGFSMAIVEAMGRGLPVVISDRCHMEFVADESLGAVVPPTAEGVRDGLAKLIDAGAERRREMGRAARRYVEQNLTWERVAEQLEEAYETLLQGPTRTMQATS